MFIEQPPLLYRLLFPGAMWRIKPSNPQQKEVYITFDDGPIPEATPWILETLDHYNIKATFFCVGDNVRKYPHIYHEIIKQGHHVGNHTYNHVQGICSWTKTFLENAEKADQLIHSPLFRPPHGHMRIPQTFFLRKKYKIVMWDVVTRDYSKYISAQKVVDNVKKYARDGSIIVFHDSIKSIEKLKTALPQSIEWLQSQGYQFKAIPYDK